MALTLTTLNCVRILDKNFMTQNDAIDAYLDNLEPGSLCGLGCDFPLVRVEVQRNRQDRVVLVNVGGGVRQGDVWEQKFLLLVKPD